MPCVSKNLHLVHQICCFLRVFLESNKTNEPFSNVVKKCFLLRRTFRGFEICSKGKNNSINNKLLKTLNTYRFKIYLILPNQETWIITGVCHCLREEKESTGRFSRVHCVVHSYSHSPANFLLSLQFQRKPPPNSASMRPRWFCTEATYWAADFSACFIFGWSIKPLPGWFSCRACNLCHVKWVIYG